MGSSQQARQTPACTVLLMLLHQPARPARCTAVWQPASTVLPFTQRGRLTTRAYPSVLRSSCSVLWGGFVSYVAHREQRGRQAAAHPPHFPPLTAGAAGPDQAANLGA